MIFARFHHIYTHRFESAYRDETTLNQAKREWAMTLSGTDAKLIEFALERCKREHAWPPTIAEFLKLLQPSPESLGLPTVEHAYLEACKHSHHPLSHDWSHICVQLAARAAGYFSLRSEPEKATRPTFTAQYKKLIEQLVQGETFEITELPALPEPDFSAEELLTQQLKDLGVEEAEAQLMAYYLEKPFGTSVRTRYRERALTQVSKLGITINLPE